MTAANLPDLNAIQSRAETNLYLGKTATQDEAADTLALLALVREQQAKLDAVAILAETWRYKGEFGWGAWQEGHGPDETGAAFDHAADSIRAALTATEGPA